MLLNLCRVIHLVQARTWMVTRSTSIVLRQMQDQVQFTQIKSSTSRRLNHEFAGRGDGLHVAQRAAHFDQPVAFHRLERSRKIAGRAAGEFGELAQ